MSKIGALVVPKPLRQVDPIVDKAAENVFGNDKAASGYAKTAVPAAGTIAERASSLSLREEAVRQEARGAGAMRSDNDADLLGYLGTSPKRRAASRLLLG